MKHKTHVRLAQCNFEKVYTALQEFANKSLPRNGCKAGLAGRQASISSMKYKKGIITVSASGTFTAAECCGRKIHAPAEHYETAPYKRSCFCTLFSIAG